LCGRLGEGDKCMQGFHEKKYEENIAWKPQTMMEG
jgi:hypothetical protein